MNGYELADEIKTMLADAESYYGEAESYLIKCETMLRQQQAEIEALKAAKIRAYNNGVEDGRKPDTNNEPVAWIIDASMTDCDDNFIWNTGNYPDWQVKDWIPLYTHPVNPYQSITDTKIEPTVVSYTNPVKEQDGCGNCHACLVGVTEHGLPVTFQRMILCPDCGNKRCPKASNHRNQCTESNEPNQRGSIYTHPVTEHFEDEPQAEELHEIMQSNAELTDEEILKIILKYESASGNNDTYDVLDCIREVLRKAQNG